MLSSCAVQGPGAAKPATVAEVEELLKEGKRLGLQLKGLPRLISMMAQARSFNMRARRALKRGTHSSISQTMACVPSRWLRLQAMLALQRRPDTLRAVGFPSIYLA